MSQKTMQLLKQAIPVFDMLKDEKRQEILMLLFEQGATSVNKITEQVSLSRPAVSHHLKL
ncbi:ArsR family transcriptional regulator, partial [Streptococcus suis]